MLKGTFLLLHAAENKNARQLSLFQNLKINFKRKKLEITVRLLVTGIKRL